MNIRDRARRLRVAPTPAEAVAWRTLRRLRAHGVHVRRQHPVGTYVVDFAVLSARLAIELDGGVHRLTADRDARRDAALAACGWRILRLSNAVAFAPDHLAAAVLEALMAPPDR